MARGGPLPRPSFVTEGESLMGDGRALSLSLLFRPSLSRERRPRGVTLKVSWFQPLPRNRSTKFPEDQNS
ncbi:hypothetical protein E2C01_064600 [Portunus trituberculatus]|uniref:Uncharacterized protein n=1 Tax=Portunus trituberculatus TaxID=210409 RepID=A0A5B7HK72_PORTR|nr:hypothetical protein [Portunus trituberculatus]